MINLLPGEYRDTLRSEYRKRLIIISLYCVIIVFFFTILTFLPAYITAQAKVTVLDVQIEAMSKIRGADNRLSAREIIRGANATIAKYEQINSLPRVAPLLIGLLATRPQGVLIDGIGFDRTSGKVTLRGLARAREDLLLFKKRLEELPDVLSVDVPVASLVRQQNATFNITISLKAETVKK